MVNFPTLCELNHLLLALISLILIIKEERKWQHKSRRKKEPKLLTARATLELRERMHSFWTNLASKYNLFCERRNR